MIIILGIFNSDEFAYLLRKAIGSNRTPSAFAKEINISKNNISLILNKKLKKAPRLSTIQKIASKADNGVTYEQLMIAAGLLANDKESVYFNKILNEDQSSYHIDELGNLLPKKLSEKYKDLLESVVVCMEENQVTPEELEDILTMLRALKKSKNDKKE